MMLTLKLKKKLRVPVFAECISPDAFSGKSQAEIADLQIWEGNRKRALDEIFEIKGASGNTPEELTIHLIGDLSTIRKIGAGMTAGKMEIKGNVGMYVGEEMKGGTISVDGNAGSWAGSAMKGGTIIVKKNAGDYIGGAYRGGDKGMMGGTIIIHGNAGTEVGGHMRNGLIKIYGNVEQFVGIRMKKGTILVKGDTGERPGAFMTGGKIVLCSHVAAILPSFTIDSIKSKAKADGEEIKEPFYLFIGDLAEHGKGKLYASKNKNTHLKSFEQMLQ
jgi:formylmethanofuran dehydrogenase subunit C